MTDYRPALVREFGSSKVLVAAALSCALSVLLLANVSGHSTMRQEPTQARSGESRE